MQHCEIWGLILTLLIPSWVLWFNSGPIGTINKKKLTYNSMKKFLLEYLGASSTRVPRRFLLPCFHKMEFLTKLHNLGLPNSLPNRSSMESPFQMVGKKYSFSLYFMEQWQTPPKSLSNQCDLEKEKEQRKSLSSMQVKSA